MDIVSNVTRQHAIGGGKPMVRTKPLTLGLWRLNAPGATEREGQCMAKSEAGTVNHWSFRVETTKGPWYVNVAPADADPGPRANRGRLKIPIAVGVVGYCFWE